MKRLFFPTVDTPCTSPCAETPNNDGELHFGTVSSGIVQVCPHIAKLNGITQRFLTKGIHDITSETEISFEDVSKPDN
jgi:hypothetical protein